MGLWCSKEEERQLLAITQEEFAKAFRVSPMKRAKLRGLKRNAAVVLGNVGTEADVPQFVALASAPEFTHSSQRSSAVVL